MRQQPKLHIYSTGAGKYIFTQPVLGFSFKEVDWLVQGVFLKYRWNIEELGGLGALCVFTASSAQ